MRPLRQSPRPLRAPSANPHPNPDPDPEPLRVAVVGRTGAGNYGHGLDVVWKRFPEVRVVAVADPDPAGRAAAAQRLGAPAAYADHRAMLRAERPDIVTIAERWIDRHAEIAVDAAEAGAHIFIEKPMARTPAECDAIVEALESRHLKGAVALQTRISPVAEQVVRLVREGAVGDLLEIRGRGKEDARGGGDDLMVLGTHVLDLARLVVGSDPRWVFASIHQDGQPATREQIRPGLENIGPVLGDRIHATYGFDQGVVLTFGTAARAARPPEDRFGIVIHGTRGVIQMGFGTLPPAALLEDPSWFPGKSAKPWIPVTSAGPGKPEPLRDSSLDQGNAWIVRDLLQSIRNRTQPRASVHDGRAALEMILGTYASHLARAPVPLPLADRKHPLA